MPNTHFAKDDHIIAYFGRYIKVCGQHFFITFFYTFYALSLLLSFILSMLFLYHSHGFSQGSGRCRSREVGAARRIWRGLWSVVRDGGGENVGDFGFGEGEAGVRGGERCDELHLVHGEVPFSFGGCVFRLDGSSY